MAGEEEECEMRPRVIPHREFKPGGRTTSKRRKRQSPSAEKPPSRPRADGSSRPLA